jgi:hypothetical protein
MGPEYTETKSDIVRRLLAEGDLTKPQIAREVGCSLPLVYQISKRSFGAASVLSVLQEIQYLRQDLIEIRTLLRRVLDEPESIVDMRLKAVK